MKPLYCESGYFTAADVTECRDLIPEKYFKPDYENDPNTLVISTEFEEGEVPLDFAFCRWLAVEKGISIMPMSNFYLLESEYRETNMIRIASCKTADFFRNPKLVQKMKELV